MPNVPTTRAASKRRCLRFWAAFGLCAMSVACAGRPQPPREASTQLAPIGGPRYLAFQADTVEDFDGETSLKRRPLGRDNVGAPLLSAVDRPTGRACVAYERALAVVNPEDADWDWVAAPWTRAPNELAMVEGRIVALEGTIAHLWENGTREAPQSQDLRAIVKQMKCKSLHFVTPAQGRPNELLVVASDYPKLFVARVSTAKGAWTLLNSGTSVDAHINNLQRCTTDGKHLYLAGAYDSNDLSTGTLRYKQELRVVRVDLTNIDSVVLVNEHLLSNELAGCRVLDFLAGGNFVAVLLRRKDGFEHVRAYEVIETGGGSAAPTWQQRVAPRSALGWLDPPRFAVFESGRLDVRP